MRRASLCGVVLMSVAVLGPPGVEPPHTIESFLENNVDLPTADRAALGRGEVLAQILATADKKEIGAAGIVRLRVPAAFFLERFRDIASFKRSELVPQVGRFGETPRIEDLDGLTFDPADLDAITRCEVGDCEVRLSARQIERARAIEGPTRVQRRERADALLRQVLVESVAAYRLEGGDALGAYQDRSEPLRSADAFRVLLQHSPYLTSSVPGLAAHLEEFPRNALPNVEDFLYWSKEQFALKPVVSVTHVAIYQLDSAWVPVLIASKQIYASHYFDTSLGVTALVRDESVSTDPAFYLVYINRSRSQSFGGLFGRIVRSIVEAKVRAGTETQLEALKQRLEADYARSCRTVGPLP